MDRLDVLLPPPRLRTPLRCDRGLIAEAVKELLFTAAGGYYAAQSGKSRKATPCDSTVRRESAAWSRWLRKKGRAKRGRGERVRWGGGGRRGKAPQAQPWEMAGKEEETAEDERETRERKPGEGVLEA